MLIKTDIQIAGTTIWVEVSDKSKHPQADAIAPVFHIKAAFTDYALRHMLCTFTEIDKEKKRVNELEKQCALGFHEFVMGNCTRCGVSSEPAKQECRHDFSQRQEGGYMRTDCRYCGVEKPS